MWRSVLRDAYDKTIADGIQPGYWEMSGQTVMLFKLDGQDFCDLPVHENPDAPLGEWWLYPRHTGDSGTHDDDE